MATTHTGIAYTNLEALQSRVLLTDLTIADTSLSSYPAGAVIPNMETARDPTMSELRPFLATVDTPDSGLIELVGPSQELADEIRTNPNKLPDRTDKAGLLTATINEDVGLYEGLHIDDGQKNRTIGEFLLSSRRLGVNAGTFTEAVRHLLLTSIDAFDLAAVYAPDNPEQYIPSTTDFRRYVSESIRGLHPPVRCLWLLLQYAESYIAPPKFIGHDGSTYFSLQQSILWSREGTWEPRRFGSLI